MEQIMIYGVDSSGEQFLLDLNHLSTRIDRAQRQISSGLRIQTASDEPDQISNLLQTRADLARNSQIRTDLGTFKLEEDVASASLDRVSQVLDRAKSLSATGITGTLSPEQSANMIQQVEGFMQEIVGIAATSVNGRHIFSGDTDQATPYSLNFAQPHGVDPYEGAATTREAMRPDGTRLPLSKTAQVLFDGAGAGESVFGALSSLRQALLAHDSNAVQNALDTVQSAQDYLRNQQVFYGNVQNQIAAATDFADNRDAALQSRLSSIQDADVAAGIVELKDLQFDRDAALSAKGKTPKTSLFDYLG
jgi:flagellar hook-associated protein 3 FlgL